MMSKKEYVEWEPASEIKHKIIVCDNPNCGTVIEEDGKQLEKEHWQTGSMMGDLLDFCSKRCLRRFIVSESINNEIENETK